MRGKQLIPVPAALFFGLFSCGESDNDKPVVNLTTLDCKAGTTLEARDDYMTICERRVEVPVWLPPKELPPPPPQIITTTVTVTADPLLVVTPLSQSQGVTLVGQRVLLANAQVSAKNNNVVIRGLRDLRVPFGNDLVEEVQLHVCPGGRFCFVWSTGVWDASTHHYRFPFMTNILMTADISHYFTVVGKAKSTGHLRVQADLTRVFDAVDLERKKVEVVSDAAYFSWQFLSAVDVQAVEGEHLSDQPVPGAADQKIAEWAIINHSKTATATQWGVGVRLFSSSLAWPCLQMPGCSWKLKDKRGVVLAEGVIRSGQLFRFEQMIFPPPTLITTSSTAVFALFGDTRDAPAGSTLLTEVDQVYWDERPGFSYQSFPWPLRRLVGRRVYR